MSAFALISNVINDNKSAGCKNAGKLNLKKINLGLYSNRTLLFHLHFGALCPPLASFLRHTDTKTDAPTRLLVSGSNTNKMKVSGKMI